LFDLRLFEVLLAVSVMKTVMTTKTMVMESAVRRETMKTMKTMKMSAVRMDEEGGEGEREVVVVEKLLLVVW